ncbi:CRISPR-associated helicase Cas3' [Streptodolium elevatio]
MSAAAKTVWAKYDRKSGAWLPLWRHLADAGGVAGLLWDEWLPPSVKSLVADEMPAGQADARKLAVWLAGTHDIGKATPTFACQVDDLADPMQSAGLAMPGRRQLGSDRRIAPHGLAGQVLLQEWLSREHGWSPPASLAYAIVTGGHHGVPPGDSQIHDLDVRPELLRTPGPSEATWLHMQTELLDACANTFGVSDRLPDWRHVRLSQPAQVLLTAIVIVSDWIASNANLFPLVPDERVNRPDRLESAWRGINLPRPWAPEVPQEATVERLFAERFDLPTGARVRSVQAEAVHMAREMPAPGMLIVEAPMGEGKTEAAMAAAEILAARRGAGGCFVALPTRATGNAMFSRLAHWWKRLGLEGDQSVFLAHAKAALNENYLSLMDAAGSQTLCAVELDGEDDEWRPQQDKRSGSAEFIAHQWLRGRKTGMLATFTVGTIDQLLFAGLKSRHLALRHLALAGKVVVIDEVHAYDTYMSVYLERVLEWLGAYRVPVVMLSATLPAARRAALAAAYSGRPAVADELPDDPRYPLLTAVTRQTPPWTTYPPAAAERTTDVRVERIDDHLDRLADLLQSELADGGTVLVVRNTVDRVLRTAAHLRTRFGNEAVTVAHSRFVDLDRAARDAQLLQWFGPEGKPPTNPHIVVASQVAEQSLDIDFDLLVTDLAPIDLMLQRMGRLHRHPRGDSRQSGRPPRLRDARCVVTGVDWRTEPPTPVPGSEAVYRLHPLLRSLAALLPYGADQLLTLPAHISPLVQEAYGDQPSGPGTWAEAMAKAEEADAEHRNDQRWNAGTFCLGEVRRPGQALVGWVDAGVGDADETRGGSAQVRDTNDNLEVLVVQRREDGTLGTLPWLDRGFGGLELPEYAAPPQRAARAVAASALRLPDRLSTMAIIEELEASTPQAWQSKECHWLAGELILVLDATCRTRLGGFELRYDQLDGLTVTSARERT